MMRDYLDRMFRYTAWADQRTLTALRDCPAAQAEALPLLAHLFGAEEVWLSRIEGRTPTVAVWPALSLDECARLAEINAAGYAALLARTPADGWHAPIHYRNTAGNEYTTPLWEILTHVVIHGGYHRGQIAKVLGRADVPAVNTDFITFTRQ
jgi:uncharacterized damage-inducible protein DinB